MDKYLSSVFSTFMYLSIMNFPYMIGWPCDAPNPGVFFLASVQVYRDRENSTVPKYICHARATVVRAS